MNDNYIAERTKAIQAWIAAYEEGGGFYVTPLMRSAYRDGWSDALAAPIAPRADADTAGAKPLTDAEIEAGWRHTFSTDNPYCPCNLKSFTKAVRWAERAKEKK